MTVNEDRPSVDERYARAIESSHLEVLPTRCSVDYLIAVGWVRDGLGASLYRTRTEFDAVRGEQRRAAENARQAADEARRLNRIADESDQGMMERARANADRFAEDAESRALTDRLLMLAQLKSLRTTRDELGRYAVGLATRTRFMRPDEEVATITGRALQLWLDPICPHCQGRKFNGGFNAPLTWCGFCNATGDRSRGPKGARFKLAHNAGGEAFGRALLAQMDRKADAVSGSLRRFLSSLMRDEPTWGAASAAALKASLVELRTAQAQED